MVLCLRARLQLLRISVEDVAKVKRSVIDAKAGQWRGVVPPLPAK